jgi:hypothetical protein
MGRQRIEPHGAWTSASRRLAPAAPIAAPGAQPADGARLATVAGRRRAGIDELRPLCPDIEQAIIDCGLSSQLPERWQQWLDRSSIEDLSRLLRRYQSPQPSAAPGVPALYQVARTLNVAEPPHGWWQDFKDWLRQWLSAPESTDPSWLNRWLSRVSLPQLLMQSLLYLLMPSDPHRHAVDRVARAQAGARRRAGGSGAVSRSSPLPADVPRLSLDEIERAPLA